MLCEKLLTYQVRLFEPQTSHSYQANWIYNEWYKLTD